MPAVAAKARYLVIGARRGKLAAVEPGDYAAHNSTIMLRTRRNTISRNRERRSHPLYRRHGAAARIAMET